MDTVINILQEVVDKMCDEYCKFPVEYQKKYKTEEVEEKLYCEKCNKCILNKLI